MFATGSSRVCELTDQAPPGDALSAITARLGDLLHGLTAADLPPEAAVELTEAFAKVERLAAAGKVLCAGRAQEADLLALRRQRSAGRWLAAVSGCGKNEADDLLSAAAQVTDLPVVDAAVRRGDLSTHQLRVICDAVREQPAAEAALVDAASRESLFGLYHAAETVKAVAASAADDAERDRRAQAKRQLSVGTSGDGSFKLLAGGGAADGVTIVRALRQECDRLFRESNARGERIPHRALLFDALVALARIGLGEDDENTPTETAEVSPIEADAMSSAEPVEPDTDGGATTDQLAAVGADAAQPRRTRASARPSRRRPPRRRGAATKVILRLDYTAAQRGYLEPGEACEISGLGPIPVAAARQILARGDPFVAAVVTQAEEVTQVVHLGRGPNALQLTALEWMNPTCSAEGCDNAILEWDHAREWSQRQETVLRNMDGLCGPEHQLKTRFGWALEPGVGKRRFLPPDHPDHPDHAGARRTRARAREPAGATER